MSVIEDVEKVAGGGSILPWAILAVVLAIGGAGALGYYKGDAARGARDELAYAQAQKKADDAWQSKLDAATDIGSKLSATLAHAQQQVQTVTVTQIQRVPVVTKSYAEQFGETLQAIPPAVYTVGFVGVWNNALDPSVEHAVPVPAGVAAGSAGDPNVARAGIDSADVLSNAIVNGGKYAACRNELNALIDWHEQNPTEQKSPQ
ncbi:hypothetical protein AWB80_07550 [Caballeronia pedi]|uniref:Uncharacterized protein n=1 Tax=Caballeronia pedi TaxID=1777141 RepID=A0A158DVJ3_9BURK|nr:hypothetical protein [Caballeronia pedi]SAK98553.1 hypothetical protein AWB80_07550 [Caballeronia pedi]